LGEALLKTTAFSCFYIHKALSMITKVVPLRKVNGFERMARCHQSAKASSMGGGVVIGSTKALHATGCRGMGTWRGGVTLSLLRPVAERAPWWIPTPSDGATARQAWAVCFYKLCTHAFYFLDTFRVYNEGFIVSPGSISTSNCHEI
jgi:hypothetical protein